MRNGRNNSVANDNAPYSGGRAPRVAKSLSFRSKILKSEIVRKDVASLLPGQMAWQPGKTHYQVNESKRKNTNGGNGPNEPTLFSRLKQLLTILIASCFILSFAGMIFGLGFSNSMSLTTLSGFAGLMTLSGFIGICFLKLPKLLKEWAALSLWLILPVLSLSVLSIGPERLAIPSAILGIGIGFISRTKTPLIATGLCLLILGYYSLPFASDVFGIGAFTSAFDGYSLSELSRYEKLALVLTVIGFLGAAMSAKSRVLLFLSLTALSLWAGIWMASTGLSQLALASAIFIVGAAQYKIGKAGLDNKAFAALTFICMGWCVGALGYLWLQSGYLFPENNTIMTLGQTPNLSTPWMTLCVVSVAAILVAGMSRHAHSRQSALSIFLTTLALGSIPFMAYQPDLAPQYISTVPGLKTIPTIGLILAAGGVVVFTAMVVNGLRLNRKLYIGLGLIALGAQLVLMLDPDLYTTDNMVVFAASFFVIGGILTLFVQSKT